MLVECKFYIFDFDVNLNGSCPCWKCKQLNDCIESPLKKLGFKIHFIKKFKAPIKLVSNSVFHSDVDIAKIKKGIIL